MIEIIEVNNSDKLKQFVYYPFKLYKNHPCWVPPLISDEFKRLQPKTNPAFELCDVKFWLAFKDGKIAGRVAGIIHHGYIEKWKHKYARFGWIDFADDEDVSRALLKTVEDWADSMGMEGVHGPLGFTDLDPEGLLIEGFEEPVTTPDIYNYPYYQRHFENYGFSKDVDWLEYELEPQKVPERAAKLAELVLARYGLTVFKASCRQQLIDYTQEVFSLLDEGYQHLYATVPLTQKQLDFYTRQYIPLIQPDYVRLLLDRNGKLVAFIVAVPSLAVAMQKAKGKLFPFGFLHLMKALKKNTRLELYLGAVRPDFQGKGLPAVIMNEISASCLKNGISKVETTKILESNVKNNYWQYYPHRQHRKRRCFLKLLKKKTDSNFDFSYMI